MRKYVVCLACFMLGAFVVSCAPSPNCAPAGRGVATVQAQAPAQTPDFANRKIDPVKHLPSAAHNVQTFNNFWTYFELNVGGKNRKFLMHHSYPKDDWQGRESLVELRHIPQGLPCGM